MAIKIKRESEYGTSPTNAVNVMQKCDSTAFTLDIVHRIKTFVKILIKMHPIHRIKLAETDGQDK